MKKIIPFILLALFAFTSKGFSQFDQPSFQLGVGLAMPLDQMKGDNYLSTATSNGFQVTQVDTVDFLRNNFGAKTGFNVFGKAKINFDKFNIVRGVGQIGFTSFNSFQQAQSGNYVINYAGQNFLLPASYNYNLNALNISLGLEIAPTSFTNVVSPYAGGYISFNNFSMELNRTENSYDTTRFKASGFRIGVNLDAGIEFKVNPQMGFALGFKYDFGNLLLKEKASANISERYDWGRTNGKLWDDGGNFYGNLGNQNGGLYSSQSKNMNWGTVYIALNFYPNAMNKTGSTKKK
ncbi:MAG: outer membrane beta-barrel protein [Bacteroidetes bacterium]|nr:outer membrane beta-barrel protein [Bacteroidota bacterium]